MTRSNLSSKLQHNIHVAVKLTPQELRRSQSDRQQAEALSRDIRGSKWWASRQGSSGLLLLSEVVSKLFRRSMHASKKLKRKGPYM